MTPTSGSNFLLNAIKGMAIGTANIIPGLSGGTIALLTGVFERLIQAIRSIDLKAIQLLLRGRFREFAQHIDFFFLLAIFGGLLLGMVLLSKLLEYLFVHYQTYTWAFFFGLVLASIYFIARNIPRWSLSAVATLICGSLIAWFITALPPAEANPAAWYLMLCGVIAICSMILPGLSGSYILILLGNYQLLLVEGLGHIRFDILGPFLLGIIVGILAFAHLLGWLLKKYHSQTIALLCGFIVGSLRSLWPWKEEIVASFGEKTKVIGYHYLWPQWNQTIALSLLLCIVGTALVIVVEQWVGRRASAEQ